MEKERKLQIIRAAVKRFIKHGIKKTTLDEVARDLRIGKATLYHYFKSKEDLYYQTLNYECSRFLDELKTLFIREDKDLRTKTEDYFNLMQNLESNYRMIYELLLNVYNNSDYMDESNRYKELLNSQRFFFKEVLTPILKNKPYTPEVISDFLIIQGWNFAFYRHYIPTDTNQVIEDPRKIVLDLIDNISQ